MSAKLTCSCGNDRFEGFQRIQTKGKAVFFTIVYVCDKCGKEAPP